jgi:hypothetical protein
MYSTGTARAFAGQVAEQVFEAVHHPAVGPGREVFRVQRFEEGAGGRG